MNKSEDSHNWQGQGQSSIEARRRVLRSLGAGGAAVGAPSLATAYASGDHCKLGTKKYKPTASAVGSVMSSVAVSKPPMYGLRCSDYRSSGTWGSGWTNGKGRSLSYSLCADTSNSAGLRFWVAFELSWPGTGSPKYRKCADILSNDPTSNEAVWLTALFNANKLYVAQRFPYTPAGVLALYKNQNPLMNNWADGSLNAKALILFRDYLSQGPA